jgi:MoxR-like ATPase
MTAQAEAEISQFAATLGQARAAIAQVIVGQERIVDGVLTALIVGGHVLLEGVPGLGKTELVKALARTCTLEFRRIQFTPDLMPADIIGTQVLTQGPNGGSPTIEFRRGPIFTQLLLADEINRATPKTQSALLETMQEGSVTVSGHTHLLTPPFCVLATQNPLEQEGTYPLPEAQLDRFLFKHEVRFPSQAELAQIVSRTALGVASEPPRVLDADAILRLRAVASQVVVADAVRDYAVALVVATHPDSALATSAVKAAVRWGASPRAAQALLRAARVRALTQGRAHASCADVRHFAHDVLRHRLILNYDGQAEGVTPAKLIDGILTELPE